jgi:transcriptional regulator with XRE-family HTH domain
MHYIKKSLADIRSLRIERHGSQAYLAELCGLSTRTIQRIEKGGEADYETKKALSAVLEIDLETSEVETHSKKQDSNLPWLMLGATFTIILLILGALFSHFHWKGANMMLLVGCVVLAFLIVPSFGYRYYRFAKQ